MTDLFSPPTRTTYTSYHIDLKQSDYLRIG